MSQIHLEACPNCGSALSETISEPRTESEVRFCSSCQHPLLLVAGKYLLEAQIAEGGFGNIFKARHVRLQMDSKRVIKFIRQEIFQRASVAERFAREVQITSYLSQRNEHIVRIFDDFGEVPKIGHYYVMEHLEGDTLAERLENRGNLPLSEALAIFRQLSLAMIAAHQTQVVHRDLKPENIFLIPRNGIDHFVKVIDFGIAKPVDGDGQNLTKGALGTPEYMPPEQCATADVDYRADIYSMGVILYEMIAGHTPFRLPHETEPRSAMHILVIKLSGEPYSLIQHRPDLGISDAFDALLLKAMHKNPAERFQSVQEMLDALAVLERGRTFFADGRALSYVPRTASDAAPFQAPISLGPASVGASASGPLPTGELSPLETGQFESHAAPVSSAAMSSTAALSPSTLSSPAMSAPATLSSPAVSAGSGASLAQSGPSLQQELFLPAQAKPAPPSLQHTVASPVSLEPALLFEQEEEPPRKPLPIALMAIVSLLVVGVGVFGGMKLLAPAVVPPSVRGEHRAVPVNRVPLVPKRVEEPRPLPQDPRPTPPTKAPEARAIKPIPRVRRPRKRRSVRRRKVALVVKRTVAPPPVRAVWSRCPVDGNTWMQVDVSGGEFQITQGSRYVVGGSRYVCVKHPDGLRKTIILAGEGLVPCSLFLKSFRQRRFARLKKSEGIDDLPPDYCLR
ncbi:MAG: protein kinase [Myxococcales bacterium]|nr:protein kinase [Myxococcales bacterium]